MALEIFARVMNFISYIIVYNDIYVALLYRCMYKEYLIRAGHKNGLVERVNTLVCEVSCKRRLICNFNQSGAAFACWCRDGAAARRARRRRAMQEAAVSLPCGAPLSGSRRSPCPSAPADPAPCAACPSAGCDT